MKQQALALMLMTTSIFAQAEVGTFGQLSYQFRRSGPGSLLEEKKTIDIADLTESSSTELQYSHPGMQKTALAIKIYAELQLALFGAYFINDAQIKEELSQSLLSEIIKLETDTLNYFMINNEGSEPFFEWLELLKLLAHNIQNKKEYSNLMPNFPLPVPECLKRGNLAKCIKIASGFNVTSGGSKDAGYVKKLIRAGGVPGMADIVIEGYLSEFDLNIRNDNAEYLSFKPESLFDPESKMLYIQLNAASSLDAKFLDAKPLNVALVIDFSHSMNEKDNTSKTRLDWVKDIVNVALTQVKENDILSIVAFNHEANVILPATSVSKDIKETVKNAVANLNPKGMTDLYKALEKGFVEVAKNTNDTFENRVVLISDAGTNTGRKEHELPALVEKYAQKQIGLTAIGVGANFNFQLVESINKSFGGNSIFVHSGKELLKLFNNFKFLISPIVSDFKANFEIFNPKANLLQGFGIPGGEVTGDGRKYSLVQGLSFFLSNSSGGAMILEFHVGDEEFLPIEDIVFPETI